MKLWQAGCGVMGLGLVVTLGSCGLFGLALDRRLEQRQIATLELQPGDMPSQLQLEIDEATRIRLALEATVLPSGADYAQADSSSTIATGSLPYEYRLLDAQGEGVDRGAGSLTGSEIIPEAPRRERSSMGQSMQLRGTLGEADIPGPMQLEAHVRLPSVDRDGREVVSARLVVHDRVAGGAGGLAAGGLLSLLAGPVVLSGGFLLFILGIVFRERSRGPA